MNAFRVTALLSLLMIAAAAMLYLWPIKPLGPPDWRLSEVENAQTTDFSALTSLFDQSALPARKIPEPVASPAPPPDPTLGLRRYRFIGLAVSDARAAGVFEREGTTIVLAPGGQLEGFTLKVVDELGAVFSNGDINELRLSLETEHLK